MTQWLTPLDLGEARLPGLPNDRNAINKFISKRGWRTARGTDGAPLARKIGKGWAYHVSLLPLEAQTRLAKMQAEGREPHDADAYARPGRDEIWDWYARTGGTIKARAEMRLACLRQVDQLVTQGLTKSAAVTLVSQEKKLSARSLHGWFALVAGVHQADWLPHLAPHYAGGRGCANCSPEAWEAIKADYLRLSRPSFESCYTRLVLMAEERGWEIPSARALKRRIEKEVSHTTIVRKRKGEQALTALYPAQERTRDHFSALEAVNIDGHKWDVVVRWPDGVVGRPMMIAIQDLYSNKMLAWRIDRAETSGAVRLAFKDLFLNFGIPAHCYLDNGRAFASKQITGGSKSRYRFKIKDEEPEGLLTGLNVQVHWTKPYSGQSKPIERAFRDLCDSVAKHPAFEGAYTGNKPDAKPENYGTRAIELDEFIRVVEQGIILHNRKPGRTNQVCGGTLSFDDAFDASYKMDAIQKPTAEQLRRCLLAAERIYSMRGDGAVRLMGNRFWSPICHETAGSHVLVRFDPDALYEGVYIYRQDGSYVGFAECVEAVGFDSMDAAKEHERKRRTFLKKSRELATLEVSMTPKELARLMPTLTSPDLPSNKVTKLVRPAPVAAPLSEEERARAAEIEAEMMSGQNIVPMPETPKRRYARALDVERRAQMGRAGDDEIKWMEAYMTSAEYRTSKSFHEDFGADWLEA